jgi:cell division protein FtsI (penicillin-binding protein 3)
MTVTEILALSSNIGTTKIAFKMGADQLRQGLLDFGFGQRIGVDLPGEARGAVQALPWRPHLLSNISFGHGIASTPLQMANAYAAIANGGVLNTPYIVDAVRDAETGLLETTKVKPIRRVLSPEQAAQMRAMLVNVTGPHGTGGNARVEGFMVGGKTGTAQKVNPNGRGYISGMYVSSFAGFIPANDPKFVIYIAVDSPRKAYYGATVAAPIFARMASYAVRKEGIAPLQMAEESTMNLKNRKLASLPVAKVPKLPPKEVLTATELDQVTQVDANETVPNLINMSTREVLRRVSGQDLRVRFVGQGLVSDVSPSVGSNLPDSREITVILK